MKFNVAITTNHPNARPLKEFSHIPGVMVPVCAPDPGVAKELAEQEARKAGMENVKAIGVRLLSRSDE